MKLSSIILYSFLAYVITAIFLFGGILQPIAFLTFWNDRLGAPFWPALALAGGFLSFLICVLLRTRGFKTQLTLPVFIVLAMAFATFFVGVYASHLRAREINAFGADLEFRNSFAQTLRNAPREFQFFLHAAALKDCVPYAWSYRTMSFYQLPNNVAINVLPFDWLEHCNITRN